MVLAVHGCVKKHDKQGLFEVCVTLYVYIQGL